MNFESDKENSSLRHSRHLNRSTILLFCILAAGLFLRIYDLAGESLWLDEGTSIRRAKLSILNIVFELIPNVHPPLYFFLLHYWISIFGDSEFSVRFPSVIFGFFSIIMMYRLGTLLFSQHIGILSSVLLAVSEFHIRFSQEARGYSMMVFLTLLSMLCFLRLKDSKRGRYAWGYVLSSSALMYTHNYGLLIILAQNVYAIGLRFLSKNASVSYVPGWFRLQALLGVMYLPWLFILLNQVISVQHGYWISRPDLNALLQTFTKYAGSWQLLSLYSVLTVVALTRTFLERNTPAFAPEVHGDAGHSWQTNGFLIVWMFTPVLLPFMISQFLAPVYHFKYTIAASLPFYILTACGVQHLRSRYLKLGIVALIIILSAGVLHGYFTKIDKQQWREVVAHIETYASSQDVIVLSPRYTMKGIYNYYSKRADLKKIPFKSESGVITEDEKGDLASLIRGYEVVWLVTSNGSNRNEFKSVLENMNYTIDYYKRFDGSGNIKGWFVIDLQVFRRQGIRLTPRLFGGTNLFFAQGHSKRAE